MRVHPFAVCGASLLWLVCTGPSSPALAGELYLAEHGPDAHNRIGRLDLATGQLHTLRTGSNGNVGPQPHYFHPTGVAVDLFRGHLYYGNLNARTISRMNLDGAGHVDVLTGVSPDDLVIDTAGGKIYWTDTGNDRIHRANLDGSGVQNLITTGLLNASGLALDAPRGRIYWSDFHRDVIGSARLDGSDVRTFPTPRGGAIDIVVDPVNDKLIWSDFDGYNIYRSGLGGENIEILIDDVELPGGLAIDPYAQRLYFVDWREHVLRSSSLDGTDVVDVYASPMLSSGTNPLFVPEPGAMLGLAIAGAAMLIRRPRPARPVPAAR